jgi:hypothetical protein
MLLLLIIIPHHQLRAALFPELGRSGVGTNGDEDDEDDEDDLDLTMEEMAARRAAEEASEAHQKELEALVKTVDWNDPVLSDQVHVGEEGWVSEAVYFWLSSESCALFVELPPPPPQLPHSFSPPPTLVTSLGERVVRVVWQVADESVRARTQ